MVAAGGAGILIAWPASAQASRVPCWRG